MEWLILLAVLVALWVWWSSKERSPDLSAVPERFVVFDLETTGLKPHRHEIIEIGAIRANRDSDYHDAFHAYVKPSGPIPKKIKKLTGITDEILNEKGEPLDKVLKEFKGFIGDLPMVAYNADFDRAFLKEAGKQCGINIRNRTRCALKMARRAWPGLDSYRLSDIADKSKTLSSESPHRALKDCERALAVYCTAASVLTRSGRRV